MTSIYVLYGHNSRNAYFPTGIKVTPDQWRDDQNKPVNSKHPDFNKLNLLAGKERAKIQQVVVNLQLKEIEPTIVAVRDALYESKPDMDIAQLNLVALLDIHIEDHCKKKKGYALNTIKNYRTTYRRLKEYTDKQYKGVLRPSQITMKFYNDFVQHLRQDKGMGDNGVGGIIKLLIAFLRIMADPDLGYGMEFPVNLTKFTVPHEEREVIYLDQDELAALEQCDFEKELSKEPESKYTVQHLDETRDLFVFACYSGLRISDLMRIGKQHNIEGDVIRMKAHKTGKALAVPILPPVRAILEKYNYILPRMLEQTYNKQIKICCRLTGIDAPIEQQTRKDGQKIYSKVPKWELISSHRAISTFCTHALERGVPANQIAKIVGKTVKTLLSRYIGTSKEGPTLRAMFKAYGYDR